MNKLDFVYQGRPTRVVFGAGSLQHLEREVLQLNANRAIILCSPEQRQLGDAVAARLGNRAVAVFDKATMHVPMELAHTARALAREVGADCAVAVGGGSTVGLGKAIALDSSLPILAIPTTYAGSEMTPIYGITESGLKKTGTDLRVLPRTVIYDPDLTVSLPVELSVTSGINAIAHAAEGLYSRDANPVVSLMAEEGIAALARSLPGIVAAPNDITARSDALYGAWLCGSVLGSVGMALHHKLCHTLGGSFNLPHAQSHTIVLPHALAYNRRAAPDAMERIARALRTDDAAIGIYELAKANGASIALKDIGLRAEDVERAAEIASGNPYWNPRPIERAAIQALIQDAFDGVPPRDH
ncbi:maleylacetate reductase [Cupriavidus consociatus]|uniref:maleylacetate reductase n=1 Tax=Cupriavidus consociatus TaxID=2821357 RepID=UPI001AE77226|nr:MULTISPECIES: maleylacetate reductase [unclassified Cupriavidus]MBP0624809.1 maleylacetate reductase [Cupriavidus sp. LEh25]MDK2661533.1 maleylacetate reductase [Cupriavidus sp. LEh21]